mgnify:CR=1 FL=1
MLQVKKRFWGKKPGFDMGDILHIAVNVVFVAVIYAMVEYWSLAPLAVVLVILSKWRVLAVQPRFWLPNVKANLVDVIVGVSSVALTYQASHMWLSIIWMALYAGWLLFLKPQSEDLWVGLQAFWAQFLGVLAIFMISTLVHQPLVVCALVWLIAWSAARHFFSNYEEPHYRSLGLIWGFLMTQLVWIALHWTQYYIIFNMKFALIAIIIAITSASTGSVYHAYKKQTLQKSILIENGLFAGALLIVILLTAHWSARL